MLTQEQIAFWCKDVPAYRAEKGFVTNWGNIRAKLMLVVTEIAEMAECVRHGQWEVFYSSVTPRPPATKKPEGFPIEVADAAIRIFDIAGSCEIDLWNGYQKNISTSDNSLNPHFRRNGDYALRNLLTIVTTVTDIGVQSREHASPTPTTGLMLGGLMAHMSLLAYELGFDLNAMIELKMAYNRQRPYRHGTVNEGGT